MKLPRKDNMKQKIYLTMFSAILAMMLVIGLSIATLVIALFGPTGDMIASFAWVVAISFVATGSLLLEVASCAGQEDV